MKSEDTNGETIGAKSDLKSARPRTGISDDFMIFLSSLRFYVKSILGILAVQNWPFLHIWGLCFLVSYEFLHFLKAENDRINKIQSL